MKKNFKITFSDKTIRASSIASSFLILITSVLIMFFYFNLPPYIPFFNSMPWGVERLAPAYYVLIFPILFSLILIINILISVQVYASNTLLGRILSVNSLIFILFGFLAFIQILFLAF